jgi:hypothetical protein
MGYRNATYVAFHAGGTSDPTASDIKYYNTLKMWDAHEHIEFSFVNSHEKTAAVRDSSSTLTLQRTLKTRLLNSKNFLLILTSRTKYDGDWVPFEIQYAIDDCDLPVIAAYPDFSSIVAPAALASYWPRALSTRIQSGRAIIKRARLDILCEYVTQKTRKPCRFYMRPSRTLPS